MQKMHRLAYGVGVGEDSHTVSRQKTQKTGPIPDSGVLGDAVYMFSECQVGTH